MAARVRGPTVLSLRSSVPSMSRAISRTRGTIAPSLARPDLDALDRVARLDPIDDVHPRDHRAEQRVGAVELRLRRERDEELAAPGVLARERHPDRTAAVRAGRAPAAPRG